MRKKLYLGFAGIILTLILMLILLHASLAIIIGLILGLAAIALYDVTQKEHAVLRNYPILGHLRYILESFGPEIRQYIIAGDQDEQPFNRQTRSLIYQRSKKTRDTIAFGTQRNFVQQGYECVQHSLAPQNINDVESRLIIGGPACTKPYSASYLNIAGMSFGALSNAAVLALNEGAKIGGFAQNTGEGGLTKFHLEGGGDLVFQIGTGYFSCRTKDGNFDPAKFQTLAQHEQVKMIEIKLSQGAKPSHGGILPAAKVDAFIAEIRGVAMGQDCISPPAHTAFATPKGLLEFIALLRELSGGKPVGFKLCIGKRSEFLAICKAMLATDILPDFITIDGAEGGTGAAPVEFVDHMGTPLNEGLLFVHNALTAINLRQHIRLIAAGKIASAFDIISKLALGADTCNAGRAFLLAMGCIQSLQCHANTCPTGIATQNPYLIRGLDVTSKKVRVANFHEATIHSFLEIIGAMGFKNPSELGPGYVFRQTEKGSLQSYLEIYEFLESGVLLTEGENKFSHYWRQATADSF